MEYNDYLQKCGNDDVIEFVNTSFKLEKLKKILEYAYTNQNKIPYSILSAFEENGARLGQVSVIQKLLADGLDAEVLKIGAKNWQKGKIRVKVILEFQSDEPEKVQPESPLDDLRQKLNENS